MIYKCQKKFDGINFVYPLLLIIIVFQINITLANKTNTTKIGDEFESKSLGIIHKMIEEEQIGHLAKHLRIYQKKGYYSETRKKNIKFDLTIEFWPPGADNYSLIYIIECKSYSTSVPVNKVEDFHNKIQQVSGVNVKGIFISNSPLQEAGYNIAKSIGMMFVLGKSEGDYNIILYKSNRENDLKKIPFIQNTFEKNILDIGTEQVEKLIDKKILGALQTLLEEEIVIDKLSKKDIEEIAKLELNKISPDILKNGKPLDVNSLVDYIHSEYKVEIHEIDDLNILGTCDIKNKTIGLNKSIRGTNRELFILAHELGHFILHQKLSIEQSQYDSFDDSEYNFRTNKHDLKNPKNWIEWQANCFASSLVVPTELFQYHFFTSQKKFGKRQGKIYLDDQQCNIEDFDKIIKRMSYLLSVSKTTVIHKLNELDYIDNHQRLKSVGLVLSEYREELLM